MTGIKISGIRNSDLIKESFVSLSRSSIRYIKLTEQKLRKKGRRQQIQKSHRKVRMRTTEGRVALRLNMHKIIKCDLSVPQILIIFVLLILLVPSTTISSTIMILSPLTSLLPGADKAELLFQFLFSFRGPLSDSSLSTFPSPLTFPLTLPPPLSIESYQSTDTSPTSKMKQMRIA